MKDKAYYIEQLHLEAHIEGGWFRQNYASGVECDGQASATSIYFLLDDQSFSALHRLTSDELWYYHGGSSLTIAMIRPDGIAQTVKIGAELD